MGDPQNNPGGRVAEWKLPNERFSSYNAASPGIRQPKVTRLVIEAARRSFEAAEDALRKQRDCSQPRSNEGGLAGMLAHR